MTPGSDTTLLVRSTRLLRAVATIALLATAPGSAEAQVYPLENLTYAVDCDALGGLPGDEFSTSPANRAIACKSTGSWGVGQDTFDTLTRANLFGAGTAMAAGAKASGGSAFTSGREARTAAVVQTGVTPVPIDRVPLMFVVDAPFLFSGGAGAVATGQAAASIGRLTAGGLPAGGSQEETLDFDSTLPPPPSTQLTVRFDYLLDGTLALEVLLGTSTFCDLFAPAAETGKCRADVFPGQLQLDQATFDARLGAQTFDLASYFVILPLFDPDEDDASDIEWVLVDDPGNAAEPVSGLGSVPTSFRISAFEITNAQYRWFLQSVAASDPNGLYDPAMGGADGGILRFGSDGSYDYAVTAGRGGHPVNFVSFWDAVRYANWLHNGQPTGAQGPGTTEDGAYTLTPAAIAANSVARNPGALVYLPGDDEWLKAGHYDPETSAWLAYPAGSNAAMVCDLPGLEDEEANCDGVAGGILRVGSYIFSPSPFGTYDQGGNAREWTETAGAGVRRVRGGDFSSSPGALASAAFLDLSPATADATTGFRVASPVAGSVVLLPVGGGGVAPLLGAALVASGVRALRSRAVASRRSSNAV